MKNIILALGLLLPFLSVAQLKPVFKKQAKLIVEPGQFKLLHPKSKTQNDLPVFLNSLQFGKDVRNYPDISVRKDEEYGFLHPNYLKFQSALKRLQIDNIIAPQKKYLERYTTEGFWHDFAVYWH